eukprot:scaffold292795_cov20-Prasinocladus_malaysianus.AAC.1
MGVKWLFSHHELTCYFAGCLWDTAKLYASYLYLLGWCNAGHIALMFHCKIQSGSVYAVAQFNIAWRCCRSHIQANTMRYLTV